MRPLQPLQSAALCLSRLQCVFPDAYLVYEVRCTLVLLAIGGPLSILVFLSSGVRGRARMLAAPLLTMPVVMAGVWVRRAYALTVIGDAIVLAASLHCAEHVRSVARPSSCCF